MTQVHGADGPGPAVTQQVRVQWSDTDGSGHYHHSSVLRWVEVAEAALYRSVGLDDIFGVVPRVHYEVDYLRPLWFGDEATVRLWVGRVGARSLELRFEVVAQDGVPVARGHLVAAHVSESGGGSAGWPADWRRKLESAAHAGGGGGQPAGIGNDERQTVCESQ